MKIVPQRGKPKVEEAFRVEDKCKPVLHFWFTCLDMIDWGANTNSDDFKVIFLNIQWMLCSNFNAQLH